MIKAFIKFGDGRVSNDPDPKSIAAALRDPKAVFWVDMERPEDEDYAILDEVFGFHPLAIEDSINRSQRPKIESYNHVGDACQQGYFYMVIHGVDPSSAKKRLETQELDLFVSERYLLTIHDVPMTPINTLIGRAGSDARVVLDPGIDLLLYQILDRLVDAYSPILDDMQDELDELEESAAGEPDNNLLPRIALKKRELLNLRRIIGPQREVLAQLTRGEVPFIRETTRIYLRDVLDHLVRAVEMIELYRDLIAGARDIYMSSISNNLNRVMKALTIITVTAVPATVITSFFGQNFHNPAFTAILESSAGFWISMGLIVALVAVLLAMFRRWKWM